MNDLTTQIDAGMGYTGPVLASGYQNPEEWFFNYVTGQRTDSGVAVNPKTALGHGPVWQAINILAGDVGQLPWNKMRWSERNGRFYQERDEDHPVDWLIGYQPNGWQTPSVWKEMMMGWALGWGNAICGLIRNAKGEREFLPFLPDRTTYTQDDERGFLIITTLLDNTRIAAAPDEVFHIRGLTSNGFWGLSAVETCKNVIGHGLALQQHGDSVFSRGAQLGGVLQSDGKAPAPEVRDEFRREWEKLHTGAKNAHRIAMLYGGMKFQPISMSNHDAEWLAARQLDREFVASLFNLPAHKLNALENAAVRANLEEQNKDYFNTSLSRWLNRFNEEAERKLLSMAERRTKRHSFLWNSKQLIRGNLKDHAMALSVLKAAEIITANESREELGFNPSDDPKADELRNAAINPANQQGGDNTGDNQQSDANTSKNLAAALVRSQVAALIETEANTVQKASETAKNLVKWASNYYENFAKTAENFLSLPAQVAVQSGYARADWRRAASDHACSSLNRLLSMAGLADKSGLAELGKDMAASIREQKDQLTAAILGE